MSVDRLSAASMRPAEELDQRPVLVAVGSSDERGSALLYAADLCRRERRPLRLVHVVEGANDANILDDEMARARSLVGEAVEVQAVDRVGDLVSTIVSAASDCQLVVLAHRRQSRLHRLLAGSVTAGVAELRPAPVVSVPEFWAPWEMGSRRVAVGVADIDQDTGVLDEALRVASSVGSGLRVVHAWESAEGHDRASRVQAAVDELGPRVRLHVVIGKAAEVLVEVSRSSDVLVVGRGRRRQRWALGRVTTELMQEALCPLEIVPTKAQGHLPRGTVALSRPARSLEAGLESPVSEQR